MNDPPLPVTIGRYRIVDALGKGSMGVVYRAHDPVIGRDVALKLVHIRTHGTDERADFLARFRQEVQAAGRCSHPSIVAVYDFLEDAGDPAIVMELVEGASLQRALRDPLSRSTLSVPDTLLPVLDGLEHAHGLGIIHRDIKPANILLTKTGKPKLADFGIARIGGSNATQAGAMLGTPSYMAPEQADSDEIDHRADLFSAGAILYQMLCGKAPFAGASLAETIARLTNAASADMTPIRAAGAGAYVNVLERALAKDPARRFQSAGEFAAALRGVATGPTADDDATIVLSYRAGARLSDPAAARLSDPAAARLSDPAAARGLSDPATLRGASNASTARPNGGGFDPDFLRHVEQHLARFAGPMARVTVLTAAATARTSEDLYAAIARSLPAEADRRAFLRSAGAGRLEPVAGTRFNRDGPDPLATRNAPKPVMAAPVSGEAIAAAQAALVVYTGPIARVLVREAAARAASGSDFIERLCAHVTKPDEQAALRQRLRRDVEPKIS